jgi:hypothetical protein
VLANALLNQKPCKQKLNLADIDIFANQNFCFLLSLLFHFKEYITSTVRVVIPKFSILTLFSPLLYLLE